MSSPLYDPNQFVNLDVDAITHHAATPPRRRQLQGRTVLLLALLVGAALTVALVLLT